MRLTDADRSLLARVDADDVTWRSNVAGRVSFRLWATEEECVIVTPRGKRLEAAGLIERYEGWQYGKGGVELTAAGKEALADDPACGKGQ